MCVLVRGQKYAALELDRSASLLSAMIAGFQTRLAAVPSSNDLRIESRSMVHVLPRSDKHSH